MKKFKIRKMEKNILNLFEIVNLGKNEVKLYVFDNKKFVKFFDNIINEILEKLAVYNGISKECIIIESYEFEKNNNNEFKKYFIINYKIDYEKQKEIFKKDIVLFKEKLKNLEKIKEKKEIILEIMKNYENIINNLEKLIKKL